MSYTGDKMIEYEEQNYHTLLERFTKKYRSEWEDFVYKEFNKEMESIPEYDRE